MDSLFKNVLKSKSSIYNREQLIKQTIIDTLLGNIKEIQYDLKENQNDDARKVELNQCEHTQSLCATLEAIFLHGLKDSFLNQTFSVLSGIESNRKPNPNFWPPLLLFSHRHAIEQITTDVGYCRCWVRQTLNDCILSSYLSNIRKSMHALIPYYKNTAFVRDGDCMELAESFIGGIEACVLFNLPLNSSLLNTWPDAPLQLSGMYVPPLISCPIASGIDVVNSVEAQYLPRASDIATNDGKHIPIPSDQCYMTAITNSPFACLPESGMQSHFGVDTSEDCGQELNDDIEHDVRLNALLSKVDEIKQRETDGTESPAIDTAEAISELYIIDNTTYQTASTNSDAGDSAITSEANQSFGNTFTYNRGWSTVDGEENTEAEKNENFIVDERLAERAGEKSSGSNSSLRKAMVRKYQFSLLHSIDFDEVWQRFEETAGLKRFKTHATKPNDATEPDEHPTIEHDDSNLDEYVVVQDETDRLLKKFTLKEIQDMVQQIYIIPRQLGLDAQNFACVSCENPLGVGAAGIATAQLCAFTGLYFCSGCMAYELHEIPSRVISNWDFQKYPISQRAAAFLNEFRYHGFIDMKILNPDIYRYVNEMSELQSLRIQLNFIRAYLFTCSESIVEGLQEQMCNREYLYEHIHRYSLSDIEIIPKGILADQIRRVISFGKQHIFNCTLCSQKGYICEICHCSRILYPFNVQTTIKCDQCGSVFHAKCCVGNPSDPEACPKCQRQRIRQHESNME